MADAGEEGTGGRPGDDSDGDDSENTGGSAGDDRPRLLLDAMLGKLATYLRICGYDAAYALDRGVEADDRLLSIARDEGRRLVTRDVELAARAPDAVRLDAKGIEGQLAELRAAGFALSPADPPVRCGACNGRLEAVGDGDPRPDHAPDGVALRRCRDCGQHFWTGSHWDDVARRLDRA